MIPSDGKAVHALAFAPTGGALAVGYDQGTIRVFEPDTTLARLTLAGHSRSVNALRYLPDGTRLVSGGADDTVRLWDAATGRLALTLRDHGNPVTGVAAGGSIGAPEPWLLGLAIGLWVGGFDILYACQDVDFDRAHGLRSIPVRFGVAQSLVISRVMHVATVIAMAALAWLLPLGAIYLAGVAIVAALLIYEQSLVSATDLSQVKRAFDLNGWVGILYFLTTGLALYAR